MIRTSLNFFDTNLMDHISEEASNLSISLWRSGNTPRKDIIENLDYLTRAILGSRTILPNGNLSILKEEVLTFQLYTIFKRYLFSTISSFFRGYYDISLANARVAFEASIYAFIFHYDRTLELEYQNKNFLKKLDKKFSATANKYNSLEM